MDGITRERLQKGLRDQQLGIPLSSDLSRALFEVVRRLPDQVIAATELLLALENMDPEMAQSLFDNGIRSNVELHTVALTILEGASAGVNFNVLLELFQFYGGSTYEEAAQVIRNSKRIHVDSNMICHLSD